MSVLQRVLVANRGEIALRVMRTCRRLGIETVAVHSSADNDAPFVRYADHAVHIGPAAAAQSYLRVEAIVDACRRTEADAVHPGYGFLSENPALPEALAAAGITWIGPSPDVIRLMGDKAAAKQHLAAAGVPVVPGIDDVTLSDAELLARLDEVGFPLLLKAVAGGGGKGMRAVHDPADAADALAAAKREAMGAFGDDRMIVEKLVTDPRHVEVQVIGDTHGTVLHVLERDCSIQRRHQKVVEEAPAAHLAPEVRAALHEAAVKAAKAVDYVGAGTVEFLLDGNGRDVYFLEMNTRLQVEHPVSELITGLDLVELQLRAAAGEPLGVAQEDVRPDGHAIEVRVYAEDPHVGFLPQTGTVAQLRWPEGPGVRIDAGIEEGSEVTPHYDPMLAKVIVHGADRAEALDRLTRAVRSTVVFGVRTNLEWLGDLLALPEVRADDVTTSWLDTWSWEEPLVPVKLVLAAADSVHLDLLDTPDATTSPWDVLGPRRNGAGGHVVRLSDRDRELVCEVRGTTTFPATDSRVVTDLVTGAGIGEHDDEAEAMAEPRDGELPWEHWFAQRVGDVVWTHLESHAEGRTRPLQLLPATRHLDLDAAGGDASMVSPMPGAVVTVEVAEGDEVTKGQTLVVVEAMKMEHPITAPTDGTVAALHVAAGDAVDAGQALVVVHPHAEDVVHPHDEDA